MKQFNLKQKIFLFILFIIGILFMVAHLVAMMTPNTPILIEYPWVREALAYIELGLIFFLCTVIIWFVIDLIIDYQVVSRQKEESDKKILELESALQELKKRS